jgi:hypothetical protein
LSDFPKGWEGKPILRSPKFSTSDRQEILHYPKAFGLTPQQIQQEHAKLKYPKAWVIEQTRDGYNLVLSASRFKQHYLKELR